MPDLQPRRVDMTEGGEMVRIQLDPDDPIIAALKLERELGLERGYLEGLLREDDWTFVIKLHALLEAAVTHVVSVELARPELGEILSRLELASAVTGKLEIGKALGCLTKEDRRCVRALTEIRNGFVHDVKQVGRSLEDYVSGLKREKWRNFVLAFGPGNPTIRIGDRDVPEDEFVRENPKTCIWMAAIFVLAMIQLHGRNVELKKEADQAHNEFLDQVVERVERFAALIPEPSPPEAKRDSDPGAALESDGT
jgi:hypothetical protein